MSNDDETPQRWCATCGRWEDDCMCDRVAEAIARAKRALAGDSNDEEHDALFELVETLESR